MCKKIQLVKNSYKLILKQQNTNTIQNFTCIPNNFGHRVILLLTH